MAKHYCGIRLLIVSWLLMLTGLATAQTSKAIPDSLAWIIKTAPRDTTYIRAVNQYVWGLLYRHAFRANNDLPDSIRIRTYRLINQTEYLARHLNDYAGLQRCLVNRGQYLLFQSRLKESLICFKQAHKYILEYHLPPSDLQRVLQRMGRVYGMLEQNETSMRYQLAAITLTEKHHLTHEVVRSYWDVAELLFEIGQTQRGWKYIQKGYELAFLDEDKIERFAAEIYMSEWLSGYSVPADLKEAVHHAELALAYANRYGTITLVGTGLSQLGSLYVDLKRYDKALFYLKKSLLLADKYKFNINKLADNYDLGRIYQKERDSERAEYFYTKSLEEAYKYGAGSSARHVIEELVKFYAESQQYKKAYAYQLKLNQINDSLFSNQAKQNTRNLAIHHESEQKEARLKLLNEQNLRIQWQRNAFFVGGILFLLLGVAMSAWLLNRARLRRLQEAQNLRQQIAHDLHDEVGSTLSSISLLSGVVNDLIARNRPESVERAIQKINTDARQILQSVDEIIWTINPGNDSLHRIALRLQEYAQPLMESKGIQFSFAVDPALDLLPVSMEVRRNLYLIGKEAINNLVKYSEATQASVRFSYAHKQLRVLIEDNGRGFDPAQLSHRTGQASMQQRAKAMGGKLNVRSAPGEGTTLELMAASL